MDSGVKPGSIGAAAPPDHVKFYRDHRAEIDPKYLTPDVLAAILRNPAGRPERIDATSCHTGSISIYLKVANVDVFRQELPRTAFAHPMAGVGDAAYWNPAGAVSAVKGPDRGCDISVLVETGVTKIRDEPGLSSTARGRSAS